MYVRAGIYIHRYIDMDTDIGGDIDDIDVYINAKKGICIEILIWPPDKILSIILYLATVNYLTENNEVIKNKVFICKRRKKITHL